MILGARLVFFSWAWAFIGEIFAHLDYILYRLSIY